MARQGAVAPSLGSESFSCPRCGALAHQTWFKAYGDHYQGKERPRLLDPGALEQAKRDHVPPNVLEYFEKLVAKMPVYQNTAERRAYTNILIDNTYFSRCFSCSDVTIWVADRIVDPIRIDEFEPAEDMPDDVRLDFREASAIVNMSPRGAAALLRLAIQKLMFYLDVPGKSLNDDIATLVSRGLDARIQKALDVLRVVGNNAVHPGQIDLVDDKATAHRLFGLVNVIVEAMISTKKHIENMFEDLPHTAKEQIAKRDAKTQPEKENE